jgi:hypothetical protein
MGMRALVGHLQNSNRSCPGMYEIRLITFNHAISVVQEGLIVHFEVNN